VKQQQHSREHKDKIRETLRRRQERVRLALQVLDRLEANGIVVLDQRAVTKGLVSMGQVK
jgi:hypothetical protein